MPWKKSKQRQSRLSGGPSGQAKTRSRPNKRREFGRGKNAPPVAETGEPTGAAEKLKLTGRPGQKKSGRPTRGPKQPLRPLARGPPSGPRNRPAPSSPRARQTLIRKKQVRQKTQNFAENKATARKKYSTPETPRKSSAPSKFKAKSKGPRPRPKQTEKRKSSETPFAKRTKQRKRKIKIGRSGLGPTGRRHAKKLGGAPLGRPSRFA